MAIRRLLYIDHHFEDKREFVIQLTARDIDVISVANMKEALGLLRSGPVHAILTETQMPDGNAAQLIQTLRGSRTFHRIPVMLLSHKADNDEKDHFLKLGAAAFMGKQTQTNDLLATVEGVLAGVDDDITESSQGISGQLAKLKIVDLLHQLADDKLSGMVAIDGDKTMSIHLQEGRVVHARHGITVGRKALYRCLLIAEATYHFHADEIEAEPTIESDSLQELLESAKLHNDKLMINYHRLPNQNHRMRIANDKDLSRTNLKAEARAALEIIRKYPRIGNYLDRFNLPDMLCYEYLLTFLDRGFIQLVEETKPVWVITDDSCDTDNPDPAWPLTVLPTTVQVGKDRYTGKDLAKLYKLKPKQLEDAVVTGPSSEELTQIYTARLASHDCFTLLTADVLSKLPSQVDAVTANLLDDGVDGQNLLANELTRLNSFTYSVGLGLLTQFALALAEKGQQVEVIESQVLQAIAKLHLLVAVHPDRSPLARKLKEPAILAWDGRTFQVVERLSKSDSLHGRLVAEIRRRLDPASKVNLLAGHVDAPQALAALRTEMTKTLRLTRVPSADIGPAAGFRLGQGALATAFFQL